MVTAVEMDKYWKFLSLVYMTEESDDPDNPNGIVEHKLEWRSDSKYGSVYIVNTSLIVIFLRVG